MALSRSLWVSGRIKFLRIFVDVIIIIAIVVMVVETNIDINLREVSIN